MAGKSVAILLDHAGNLLRHGFPDDSRDWSLDRPIAAGNGGQRQPSLRICLTCFLANCAGAQVCKGCGAPFAVKPRTVAEHQGELRQIARAELEAQRQEFRETRRSARSYHALLALGRKRGMKSPHLWAKHVLKARGTI